MKTKLIRRTMFVVIVRGAFILMGSVAGIIASVVVAELSLRVTGYQIPPYANILLPVGRDQSRPHGLRPNAEGWVENTYVKINSKGLRDREYSSKKDDVFRIFVLGRCVTFGHGIALENTSVKRLEADLNSDPAFKGKTTFEVINGGIPEGYRSTQGLVSFFQKEGIQYNPDLLILEWGLRPQRWLEVRLRQPLWVRIIATEIAPRMPRSMHLTWYLYQKATGYRWKEYWDQVMAEKGEVQRMLDLNDPSTAYWKDEEIALIDLLQFAHTRKIPTLVVVLPWMNYFEKSHPFEDIYRRVLSIAESHGAKTLNLLPAFIGRDPEALWLNPTNRRPNEAGHAVIERNIRQTLVQERLLPRHTNVGD